MKGVLFAQYLNLTRKGSKFGVIDTGIDCTHLALSGCFGVSDWSNLQDNCLIKYEYDLVGDSYEGGIISAVNVASQNSISQ